MGLPIFKDDNKNIMLMQSAWSNQINPILVNPLASPSILTGVPLTVGSNVINHKLGRKPIGWFVINQNVPTELSLGAELNNLTLTLTATVAATVTLVVV